uniref:H15 domain-containing protein n=1 Tax=Anopheles funestus TaxID=62324 RepID=A0A182RK52_ANOFN
MSVKKITIAEEISTTAMATELKTESQLISITANNHDSNGKASKKTYELMIIDAITENDPRRKGISFALIKKFIKGKYQIEGEISSYIKKAFEKLSNKGSVERVSGSSGISGSIRLTKDHVESVKKQQKLAAKAKPKPKNPKQTKKQLKTKPKKEDKDTNNNNKKKGHASKVKPTPHAKLSTKKTAITKTKLARSGGKVRLSIATVADPMPSTNVKTTKTKMKAPKTSTAEKPAKTNGQKKPKPTKVRND